jgi:hypothetical protein
VKGNWQEAREELQEAYTRQVRARGTSTAGLPGWREMGAGGGGPVQGQGKAIHDIQGKIKCSDSSELSKHPQERMLCPQESVQHLGEGFSRLKQGIGTVQVGPG